VTAGSFDKLQTTWQAQLTITSLSFIILILNLRSGSKKTGDGGESASK
jgi:hypothetical protein